MNSKYPRVSFRRIIELPSWIIACGVLIVAAGAITALACGWSYVTDHSVRFNSYRTGRDFYRLPPLPIMYDPATGKDISASEQYDYAGEYEREQLVPSTEPPKPNPDEVWNQVGDAIEKASFTEAKNLLQGYLEITLYDTRNDEPERQTRRNRAYDMLDAITALGQGSKIETVRTYFESRYNPGSDVVADADEDIVRARADINLKDNWDYLSAASLYIKGQTTEALEAFSKHLTHHPTSEKREAVLYMIAKINMESSHGFQESRCGLYETNTMGEETDESKIEPAETCRDDAWQKSSRSFQELIRRYPDGRYVNDARGWLAFLYKRGGDRSAALAEYYSLLGNRTDRRWRLEAKKSLQVIGHDYDDETLDKLESLIANDADTAMAYAYHRIYNHAVDLSGEDIAYWRLDAYESQNEETLRVAEIRERGNHELRRIAAFATAMIARHSRARVGAGFVLRVAQAQLELQDFPTAQKLAERALKLGLDGDLRTQGLWVKGSSEHCRKDFPAARKTFVQLIAESPGSKFIEGARRLLAMTAEDQGDLETALEQYLALDYQYDVAYFVDILLPTDRLAKFVSEHTDTPKYNHLLYALGIRYLREKRWDDARSALRRVQTKYAPSVSPYEDYSVAKVQAFSKEPDWDWREPHYIKTSWVMQDLKTIDVMERLEHDVENAEGEEAIAEAMYQLASFQFDADDLLFYNPDLWKGQRSDLLAQLDTGNNLRLANESQTIFEYSQSHEPLARAIPIYLEIVNKYPKAKAASDALFSAAVADQRLADLNNYWRELYTRGLFADSQPISFAEIGRLYPKFRWPKSRLGWEASTRTVNGGPAYPPRPTPVPQLTREQKIRGIAGRLYNDIKPTVEQKYEATVDRIGTSVTSVLDSVLTVIAVLLGSYVFLLWVHFAKPEWLNPPPEIADYFATSKGALQVPQDPESPVVRLIDNDPD